MDPLQTCLSTLMRHAGHSLDPSCRLCVFGCQYAAPCGCGSLACIDGAVGARRSGLSAAA